MGIIADHFKQLENSEFVQAINELRNRRINAQQKRRINSFGRWSKIMRNNRLEGDNKYEESN